MTYYIMGSDFPFSEIYILGTYSNLKDCQESFEKFCKNKYNVSYINGGFCKQRRIDDFA